MMKIFNINVKIIFKNYGTTDSVSQWVFWVWVGLCLKPDICYGFFFLKFINSPNNPTRPTFLSWIGGFDRVK
jgi:hypothetical protein